MKKISVLMVCMGNICRSPMAHGYFEQLVRQSGLSEHISVDSAGTHAYHVGNPPDPRAQQTARGRGVDLSSQRARQAMREDFQRFDYVLAMDKDNYRLLAEICPEGQEHKLRLFLEFAPHLSEREVPDPYYGGASGFEQVFDMVEAAAAGLLEDIRSRHGI